MLWNWDDVEIDDRNPVAAFNSYVAVDGTDLYLGKPWSRGGGAVNVYDTSSKGPITLHRTITPPHDHLKV